MKVSVNRYVGVHEILDLHELQIIKEYW